MTDPHRDEDWHDQDAEPAEPTMTAPPEDRPDATPSAIDREGRDDSPDAVDTDDEQ